MDIKKVTGDLVRQKRVAKEWTQEKLSSEAGINNRFLQKIEAGHRMPSLLTLFKIATAFGVAPDKLVAPIWKEWQKEPEIQPNS
ncbi:helix-turn-helix transcriptional regulator [Exilibacterium tricleocarpae]|uniref:Helix-turn-helix transcriptional regulator n=1 Tax=Exilibacterium tricleocarpae TaxID=2591008 RepID=A0A545SY25_9GAMM|nr:helix-turn-helix transcriptional regulator [Exilibacterium tricleocarpae]TQV69867.1 helix-turn-helix transcriptional regulator [Exilibacterium tricleocarpae]